MGHLLTYSISSQPRYDHFDTAAYKDQPVKSDYTIE